MIYATLREALYDFFTHNAPLVSAGGYHSSDMDGTFKVSQSPSLTFRGQTGDKIIKFNTVF